jgi:hypothetical protein
MFYENYVILLGMNSHRYCKLTGHRSFVANVGYSQKDEMVISAGMDHRISLVKMAAIKENNWYKPHAEGNNF